MSAEDAEGRGGHLFCPRRRAVPDGCREQGTHKGCPYVLIREGTRRGAKDTFFVREGGRERVGGGSRAPTRGAPRGGLGVGQQVGLGVQEKFGAIVREMPARSDCGKGRSAAFWVEMFSTWRLEAAR